MRSDYMEGLMLGKTCLYVLDEMRCRPALITSVRHADSGEVDLTVFLSPDDVETALSGQITALLMKMSVRFSLEQQVGTWHWLDRDKQS